MRFGTFSYNQARPWASEQQAYDELLEQIEFTDRLGFNEAWFAEHHHSDYGLIASPNLIIAALARRTKHLRMGNLISVLPLYDPMRFAEECAMLDILTNGRLNVGIGRGVPKDDMKHRLDRETAQARFDEAVDLLMRAWSGETFSYEGKAWSYQEISCRPHLLQRPHPPIYYGATSPQSPVMIAQRGWNLALSRQPIANCARAIQSFRNELKAVGRNDGDAIMVRDIYVADSDEQAWREAAPELTRYWQLAAESFWGEQPISTEDLPKFTERYAYYPGGLTMQRMNEWGTSLIGSPDTVIKQARTMIGEAKPDCLVGMFSFGGLKHDQVMHSLDLFGIKVLPFLAD